MYDDFRRSLRTQYFIVVLGLAAIWFLFGFEVMAGLALILIAAQTCTIVVNQQAAVATGDQRAVALQKELDTIKENGGL